MLVAARDAGIRRFVYASSSAVYGDDPTLPKWKTMSAGCFLPTAATKTINEVYAGLFCGGLMDCHAQGCAILMFLARARIPKAVMLPSPKVDGCFIEARTGVHQRRWQDEP